MILFCYIIYPSLINLVRSRWLEFNLFLFGVFMNHDLVSVHKNIRIRPTFSPLSLTLGQWHTCIYIYILQSSHLNFGVDIANGKLNACKSDAEIIERVWVQIRNRSEKLTNVYHEVQTWRKSKEIF